MSSQISSANQVSPGLLRLLGHRYGDGLVYLRDAGDNQLYGEAVRLGFISTEGYLTREGRALLARCSAE